MSAEADFLRLLRPHAGHPAARGLLDDAAVLDVGGRRVVLTTDLLVEGVHYLPDDPPEDVAWKLLAVNLSDLAAKAARPVGALLGYMIGADAWDRRFVGGLGAALGAFDVPLLGGDTVSAPAGAARTLSLTLIGEAWGPVPSRAGAGDGDHLWVSGAIGDAGAGLAALRAGAAADDPLVRRYRAPRPRLEAGQKLGPLVHAMMDVSDGLLLDARRMAAASAVAIELDLDTVPLGEAFLAARGDDREARLFAATAGDDYELLFAAPAEAAADILRLGEEIGVPLSRIGRCVAGAGLFLRHVGERLALPERLGFEHHGG